MTLSDINWLAILAATLVNLLMAYLFFESRFATKWREATKERSDSTWTSRGKFSIYLTYSFLLALVLWAFAFMSSSMSLAPREISAFLLVLPVLFAVIPALYLRSDLSDDSRLLTFYLFLALSGMVSFFILSFLGL